MENKVNSKKYNIILSLSIIVIIGSITAIAIIYSQNKKEKEAFTYEAHLDSTVLTIDGYEFSLRELSYYIIKMEAYIDQSARAYDSSNPTAYWNVYIGDNYVRNTAKDLTIGYAIRDYVYSMEAEKLELTLDEERVNEIYDETYNTLKALNGNQMSITNYSVQELYNILYRIALAEAYVSHITKDIPTLTEEDINPEGYYYEQIVANHEVKIEDKIWDNVNMGHISINK